MNKLSPIALFLTAFLLTKAHANPPSGYEMTWSDDFNTTALDSTKWGYRMLGPWRDATNATAAVTVAGGNMTITNYTVGTTHYAAEISTQGKWEPIYGYFEARIKYQDNPGAWSAFWLQSPTTGTPVGSPTTAGVEMDITEHRAVDASSVDISTKSASTLHWDGYGTDHKSVTSGYETIPSVSTDYHVYGWEWTPTAIKGYIDDVLAWTVPATGPISNRSEYMILSKEIQNASWAGNIPAGGYGTASTSSTKMLVDWVKYYRRTGDVSENFESGTAGSPQAGWSLSATYRPTVESVDSTKALSLHDDSATMEGWAVKAFADKTSSCLVDFRFKQTQQIDSPRMQVKYGSTVAVDMFAKSHSLWYRDAANTEIQIPGTTFSDNQWKRVRIAVNPATSTFSVYMDEARVLDYVPFKSAVTTVNALNFASGVAATAGTTYIDDIYVK